MTAATTGPATTTVDAEIVVSHITPNPDQPRKLFDQAALEELAQSIREHGLLQPIVVHKVADPDDLDYACQPYQIIAGERRWRAAQIAGLDRVPCRVITGLDEARAFVLSVVENVNRKDMTDMEEAHGYATMRAHGATVAEIAQVTGKTTRWVQIYLDLLDLDPQLQTMLVGGGIRIGVAHSFSRLNPAGQQVALRKWLAGDFTNDHDARAYATAVREQEAQGGLFAEPVTEEERAEIARKRRALMSKLNQLTKAWDVCREIARLDPVEVAEVLAGDGGAATYRETVGHVVAEANKALAVLRRATAADAAYRASTG